MVRQPSAEEQVRFLLNLRRLLEEGGFVVTYKHTLLLSLADVCVEKGDDRGGKLRLSTHELAEKFIIYYWRQAIPYHSPSGDQAGIVLKQNTGKQAAIISAVSKARETYGGSLAQLKKNPQAWEALKRNVAQTIRIMPLWKLQTVGG